MSMKSKLKSKDEPIDKKDTDSKKRDLKKESKVLDKEPKPKEKLDVVRIFFMTQNFYRNL